MKYIRTYEGFGSWIKKAVNYMNTPYDKHPLNKPKDEPVSKVVEPEPIRQRVIEKPESQEELKSVNEGENSKQKAVETAFYSLSDLTDEGFSIKILDQKKQKDELIGKFEEIKFNESKIDDDKKFNILIAVGMVNESYKSSPSISLPSYCNEFEITDSIKDTIISTVQRLKEDNGLRVRVYAENDKFIASSVFLQQLVRRAATKGGSGYIGSWVRELFNIDTYFKPESLKGKLKIILISISDMNDSEYEKKGGSF